MAWRIELDPAAVRELDKIDPQIARRILAFLHGRVAELDDPRSIGKALKGSKLGEFWKYRVGCPRRFKFDPPCRFKSDPGSEASHRVTGCA